MLVKKTVKRTRSQQKANPANTEDSTAPWIGSSDQNKKQSCHMMFRKIAFPFSLSLGELRYGPKKDRSTDEGSPGVPVLSFTAMRLTL